MARHRAQGFGCCPPGDPNDMLPMWRLVWTIPAGVPTTTFHDDATFFTGCRNCGWQFGSEIGCDSSNVNPPLLGVTHNWADFVTINEYPLFTGGNDDDDDDDKHDDDTKGDGDDGPSLKRPRASVPDGGGAAWRNSGHCESSSWESQTREA